GNRGSQQERRPSAKIREDSTTQGGRVGQSQVRCGWTFHDYLWRDAVCTEEALSAYAVSRRRVRFASRGCDRQAISNIAAVRWIEWHDQVIRAAARASSFAGYLENIGATARTSPDRSPPRGRPQPDAHATRRFSFRR